MPNSLKLKRIKCNQDILTQSWGLILSNSNWKYNVSSPTNESARNRPITESIYYEELLFNTIYQSLSTNWHISFTQLQWQTVSGQSRAKYKQHHLPLAGLECRNSKSSRQKSHAFKCEYLSFHTVYGLETLRIHLYSSSLCASQVLITSALWPKIWLEGL